MLRKQLYKQPVYDSCKDIHVHMTFHIYIIY